MREIVTVDVSVSEVKRFPGWQQLAGAELEPLQPAAASISPHGLFIKFTFDRYPEGLHEAKERLQATGISVSTWVRREYDPEELLNADFLDFGTEDVVSSVAGTLRWNFTPLCPYCGFQETRWDFHGLAIKDEANGNRVAMVDWHPLVITASLADELRSSRLSGLDLVPVGQKSPPLWYALQPGHTLSPLQSPPTRLHRLASATSLCERDHNWERPDSEFYYQIQDFSGLDFNRTYELFGATQSPTPALIVSSRFYRRLVELGVEKLVCEPVRFIS